MQTRNNDEGLVFLSERNVQITLINYYRKGIYDLELDDDNNYNNSQQTEKLEFSRNSTYDCQILRSHTAIERLTVQHLTF